MEDETYEPEWFEEISDLEELLDVVQSASDDWICKNSKRVHSKDVRLDSRIGYIHVTKDGIAVPKSMQRTIEYYGGFEYIDKNHVFGLGDWVIYRLRSPEGEENSRISDVLIRAGVLEEMDEEDM